jgi:uncharacterized damage-inducible protein DinB
MKLKTSITLKQILLAEAETTYTITRKLFKQVTDADLSWKPATGRNWMTVGQLLMHCASFGCGKAVRGFVKGDWGLTEEVKMEDMDAEQHVPPAEKLASVDSITRALELLAHDRQLTLQCIKEVNESTLLTKRLTAPWGGPDLSLFQHLLLMIAHLNQHKGQLFYYLKLMGKDLNTTDLWGA